MLDRGRLFVTRFSFMRHFVRFNSWILEDVVILKHQCGSWVSQYDTATPCCCRRGARHSPYSLLVKWVKVTWYFTLRPGYPIVAKNVTEIQWAGPLCLVCWAHQSSLFDTHWLQVLADFSAVHDEGDSLLASRTLNCGVPLGLTCTDSACIFHVYIGFVSYYVDSCIQGFPSWPMRGE